MFKNFLDWLSVEPTSAVDQQHSLQLATAVLLFEIIRSDNKIAEQEIAEYKRMLLQHFVLEDAEIKSLLEQAESESSHAVDLYQYTNVINQHCQQAQKVTILESLWRVAYADGHLDVHEEHIIRRLADLLHIPHSSFIKTKLSAATSTNPPE
jgi:uncharacterized tellurite resistance protein B-like protein